MCLASVADGRDSIRDRHSVDENTINSLPLGWTKTTLGELARPTRPRHEPKEYPELPFIGMEHVEAQTMRLLGTVPAKTMASSAVHFYPDDVLYGRLRPYLNKVCRPDFEGLCSGEFIVFPASENMDSKFLQYLLNSADFVSFTSSLNTGDRPRVDYGQMAPYGVKLPPLNEQRRIVQEIEKHFSRLDAAVSGLKHVRANLDRYRASVLKAACEGRLVPAEADLAQAEGRTYQPAEKLLARVLEERRARWEEEQLARMNKQGREPKNDKWKLRYEEPTQPDTSGLPRLPEGWLWTTIESVGDVLLGRQRAPQYLTGKYPHPYLRVANVFEDYIDFSDVKEMDFDPDDFEKYRLEPDDILINEGQSPELVGRSAIYKGGVDGLCFQKTLHRFRRFKSAPSAKFVQTIFLAYLYTGVFREASSLTVNIAHLTLERIKPLRFPLPPLAEQERIVAEVERRLSVVKELEVVIKLNLRRAERLRQAVLKRAFEGKLVAQDPADEPAEILLERIKAERAAAATEGTSRGRRGRGQPGVEWPQVDGAAKGAAPAAEG